MATNHDTSTNQNVEKTDFGETQHHDKPLEENGVELGRIPSDTNNAADSDQGSESKDFVRTIRGFKVRLTSGTMYNQSIDSHSGSLHMAPYFPLCSCMRSTAP